MTTETTDKPQTGKEITPKNEGPLTLKQLLGDPKVKDRFAQILGAKAPGFISSIISTCQSSDMLSKADPNSIVAAAAVAASLDLPIIPSLGQAGIVPYKDRERGVLAQFQMQWKGYVQLAHRTGKYRRIHLAPIFEGQLKKRDRIQGVFEFDEGAKKSDKVEGFYFFFELLTGYRHEAYWSVAECVEHGWKFSKAFSLYGNGQWMDDPLMPKYEERGKVRANIKEFKGLCTPKSGLFSMCAKTVVKNEIGKWGPMSTEKMQDAVRFDQAVVKEEGGELKPEYIDSTAAPTQEHCEEAERHYETPPMEKPAEAKAEKAADPVVPANEPTRAAGEEPNTARFNVERVGRVTIGRKEGVGVVTPKGTLKLELPEAPKEWDGKFYSENEKHLEVAKEAQKSGKELSVNFSKVAERLWIDSAEVRA